MKPNIEVVQIHLPNRDQIVFCKDDSELTCGKMEKDAKKLFDLFEEGISRGVIERFLNMYLKDKKFIRSIKNKFKEEKL